MVPGKTYKPEDYLEILWRRRLAIGIPLLALTIGAAVYSHMMPDLYESEAEILVVPQRVPETYIRATVTSRIEDRLAGMSQQIESRSRLEQIIKEFNLYSEELKTNPMEDVVEQMRVDINIGTSKAHKGNSTGGFRVSYRSRSAKSAMQVTEKLASLFIEENLKERANQAEQTSQFLDTQLEQARTRLEEHEKKLEDYRKRYGPEMPAQQPANVQAMQNAQLRLQSLRDGLARDRDRRIVLDQQIADASTAIVTAGTVDPLGTGRGLTYAEQLEAARDKLRALQMRYEDAYPAVRAQRDVVAELEQKAAKEAKDNLSMQTVVSAAVNPAEAARRRRLGDLQAQKAGLESEIRHKEATEAKTVAEIDMYQQRISATPTRESELVSLNRDYLTLQQQYQTLLLKKEDSKVAESLERRQIGEQFRIIDPARMPMTPVSPNRKRINLLGAAAGLAFGLVLAGITEYRDTSVRTEDDVIAAVSLPVLALVPLMLTEHDRVRRRRQRWIVISATTAVLVVSAVVFAWRSRLLQALVG